jgi:hypothetical protein
VGIKNKIIKKQLLNVIFETFYEILKTPATREPVCFSCRERSQTAARKTKSAELWPYTLIDVLLEWPAGSLWITRDTLRQSSFDKLFILFEQVLRNGGVVFRKALVYRPIGRFCFDVGVSTGLERQASGVDGRKISGATSAGRTVENRCLTAGITMVAASCTASLQAPRNGPRWVVRESEISGTNGLIPKFPAHRPSRASEFRLCIYLDGARTVASEP